MNTEIIIQLCIAFSVMLALYLAIKLIIYLKTKNTNTGLWGTVFEGLMHNTVPQETLKEPEVYIEKKVRKAGQGNDILTAKE